MLYLIVLELRKSKAVSPANQLLSAHSCARVYAVNFAVLLYSIIYYAVRLNSVKIVYC